MTTISKSQLLAILRYMRVPEYTYKMEKKGIIDACDVLEYTENGWEVYATERGSKYDIQILHNETDACLELLKRSIHVSLSDKTLSDFNLRQLHSILVYLQVPEALYDFSGDMTKTGAYSIEWTERGWEEYRIENSRKHRIAVFGSEADACFDLLYRVVHL